MREYRFRGKSRYNEKSHKIDEWIYGDLRQDNGRRAFICERKTLLETQVQAETIGQYTGLKDKNKKEIYEGDIVKCKQYIGGNFIEYCIEKGFVEFKNGEFGLHRKQGYYQSLNKFIEYDYELEKIGNIYENKNLLEKG